MDHVLETIGIVVLVALSIWAAVAAQLWLMLQSLLSPKLALTPLSPTTHRAAYAHALRVDAQVKPWGFQRVGCYRCNTTPAGTVLAWRRPDRPVFLCIYFIQGTAAMDFVSEFAGDVALTTGNAASGGMMPITPGSFRQLFPKMGMEKLWRKHCEAEIFLHRTGGAAIGDPHMDLETAFIEGVRRQARYVRTLPFWAWRGIFWYGGIIAKRRGYPGVSIAEQHERGLLVLPNDLDFEVYRTPPVD